MVGWTSARDQLAAAGTAGYINMWDATTGELLAGYQSIGSVTRLVFDPSVERIWSFDVFGNATYWDLMTNVVEEEGHTRAICTSPIWDAELSRDGKFMAAAAFDGKFYVFETNRDPENSANYSSLYTIDKHGRNVTGTAFDPTRDVVVSAGLDGTVRLWDLTDGEEMMTLTSQPSPVNGVDFSPDGKRVVTAGSDGQIRVYQVSLEDLMETAESQLSRGFTEAECQTYLHLAACPEE